MRAYVSPEPSPLRAKMPDPNQTTGSLAYAKLLLTSKLFRGGFLLATKLQNFFGKTPPLSIDPRRLNEENITVSSSKSCRQIRVTVYKNEAAINAEKKGGKSAVHIHWYGQWPSCFIEYSLPLTSSLGGGWILPHTRGQTLPYITTLLSSPLLASYPLTIFDATYALSPENPCPAELEDARDVYEYVLAHPYRWDADRISFSGNSSGGAIALGLAVTLGKEAREACHDEDTRVHPVKAVVVYYAMTNWIGVREKNTALLANLPKENPPMFMPEFVLDTITAAHFFAPPGRDPESGGNSGQKDMTEAARKEALQRSPMVSPALADVRDFPHRVGIWTVEWDGMSIDADELRERLKTRSIDGKGDVSGRWIKGMGHGWDLEVRKDQAGWTEKEEAHQDLVRAVAWVDEHSGE